MLNDTLHKTSRPYISSGLQNLPRTLLQLLYIAPLLRLRGVLLQGPDHAADRYDHHLIRGMVWYFLILFPFLSFHVQQGRLDVFLL
jgi:hypothetical protein